MSVEKYYYLISSLPSLRLGERTPWSSAEFIDRMRDHLDQERHHELECVSLLPDETQPGSCCVVEAQWRAWETYVRNLLLKHRTAGAEEVSHWHRHEDDVFPGFRRQIEEAMHHADPLSRELGLDQIRWNMLEHFRVTFEFDFEALVVYRLQLLLAEVWAARETDIGMDNLRRIVIALEDQACALRKVVD